MYSELRKYSLSLILCFAFVQLCDGQNNYFNCIEDFGKNKIELDGGLDYCAIIIGENYCTGCVTKLSLFLQKQKEQNQSDLKVFILVTTPSNSIVSNRSTLNRIQHLSYNLFPVYFNCESSILSNERLSPSLFVQVKGEVYKFDNHIIFREKTGFLKRKFKKEIRLIYINYINL